MAKRPFFVGFEGPDGLFAAEEVSLAFKWHAGFSTSQKQLSIQSLHASIRSNTSYAAPLEISTKSLQSVGVALSAFNLMFSPSIDSVTEMSVETAYQGCKQYGSRLRSDEDRFSLPPREARLRARELQSDLPLTGWLIDGHLFDLHSHTSCYDWIYLSALSQNQALMKALLDYDCFTDIEFNPRYSLACQARTAALAGASIRRDGSLDRLIRQCLQRASGHSLVSACVSSGVEADCDQLSLGV